MKKLMLTWSLLCSIPILMASGNDTAPAISTEGGRWLEWGMEAKYEYVQGYVTAYQRGFYEACGVSAGSDSQSARSDELSVDQCRQKTPRYSKNLSDYADEITQYYRKYPDDLNVALSELLEAFSDSRHLTLEQTHAFYAPSAKKLPKE